MGKKGKAGLPLGFFSIGWLITSTARNAKEATLKVHEQSVSDLPMGFQTDTDELH